MKVGDEAVSHTEFEPGLAENIDIAAVGSL